MKKTWFYRLLLSYLPIFFIVVFMLIVMAVMALRESSEQAAIQANHVFLNYIVQVADQQMEQIDNVLIKEITNDSDIQHFFYQTPGVNSHLSDYAGSKKLRSLVDRTDLVHSIYFYRATDQIVLTPESKIRVDESAERDFILKMHSSEDTYRWTDSRVYAESTDHPVEVVTLVRKVPILSGDKGIVVINVSLKALRSMLVETFAIREDQFFHVYDAHNQVLVEWNGRGKWDLDALSTTNRVSSHITSDYTGWSYYSGIHNGALTLVSSSAFYGVVILVLLLVGTGWIVYISRRHYKPIEQLIHRITSYSKLKTKTEKDEFNFIGHALEKLIEQSNSYEVQREEELVFTRKRIFKDLVKGEHLLSSNEWIELSEWVTLSNRLDHAVVMVVEIDKYSDFCAEYSRKDQTLIKFVMHSVIVEISSSISVHAWIEWVSNHQLAVLCFIDSQDENDGTVLALGENLSGWVEENLKYTVTIGVGTHIHRPLDISHSYEEALEALKYKSTIGSNTLISARDVSTVSQGQVFKHLQIIRSMTHSFRLDEQDWHLQLERLFEEMERETLSREDIISMLNYLIYQIYRELAYLPEEIQDHWTKYTMVTFHDLLNNFDTIHDLHAPFHRLLGEVSDKWIQSKKMRKNHELIQEIREYIEKNYANPDLSLTYLNEAFNMNAKYISQLFKEEFGEKFIDYVTRVRIQHAKTLLEHSADPIQAIGEQVGYVHAFTFIRAFKKVMGTTPGDFRKALKE